MPDDLVLVLTTSSVPEGEIVRARLEDEGIPVLVKGEGAGPYRMGPVHLFVPADLEVQARLVLETLGDGVDETAEADQGFEESFDDDRNGTRGAGRAD